jgi:hypothetical protein
MPPRIVSVGIVLFWAATLGWFVRREVWPYFIADGAPPFVIELADEAMRQAVPVRWAVTQNDRPLTSLTTRVEYRDADDTFDLTATTGRPFTVVGKGDSEVKVTSLRNLYRVSRGGFIQRTETQVGLAVGPLSFRVAVAADVREGTAYPKLRVESPFGDYAPQLDPVATSSSSVLNPMHPVHRVNGLRPGMVWRVPLVDPTAEAIAVAANREWSRAGGPGSQPGLLPTPRTLVAEVTGPRPLVWNGREHDCLVIEYYSADYTARTWVRERDGTVLRQEANAPENRLVLQREL